MLADSLPRTYRLHRGWSAVFILGGLMMLAGVIAMPFLPHTPPERSVADAPWLWGPLLLVGAAVGVMSLALPFTYRLTIGETYIEKVELRRMLRLELDDIVGYRSNQHGLFFCGKKQQRSVQVVPYLKLDQVFREWQSMFPDLDDRDAQKALDEQLASAEHGELLGERQAGIERARWIGRRLTVATIAVLVWAWVYPRPYRLVVPLLATLPVLSLILLRQGRGFYVIFGHRKTKLADLALPLIAPGAVLTLRALSDIQLVNVSSPWPMTMVMAALLTGIAAVLWREARRPISLLAIFMLTLFYSYGSSVELNCLDDHSPSQLLVSKVLRKHMSGAKGPHYHLDLAPWGPLHEVSDVNVSAEYFRVVNEGDTTTLRLRSGLLGWPWFSVDSDQDAGSKSTGK